MSELKTLKDLNLYFSDRMKLGKEFLVWAKKNNVEVCPASVIGWIQNKIRTRDRKEAVKWIKHFEKAKEEAIFQHQLLDENNLCEKYFKEGQEFINQIDWIKRYFNITEEDLK